jgi:hypothetical protein
MAICPSARIDTVKYEMFHRRLWLSAGEKLIRQTFFSAVSRANSLTLLDQ